MKEAQSHHRLDRLPFPAEAAILAGGVSRRMGRDKAWLQIGGRPVVESLASTLKEIFRPVRIISNRPEPFRALPFFVPVQADLRPGCGPLGGIHAALATARGHAVFVTACDLPFLAGAFAGGLTELLADHDAVVPRNQDRPVPVCALYTVRCLDPIERQLDRGDLRAAEFLREVDVRWVDGSELLLLDPEGLALMNLNDPADYRRALEIASKRTAR